MGACTSGRATLRQTTNRERLHDEAVYREDPRNRAWVAVRALRNDDFILRNDDFILRNDDFPLKNDDFLLKNDVFL